MMFSLCTRKIKRIGEDLTICRGADLTFLSFSMEVSHDSQGIVTEVRTAQNQGSITWVM